ncbi:hypothetical protein LOZ58_006187 [Ophidiomyces ophidiicola]|nr:hypothetical protein LOZ65_004461 [Ophidiomyces ophidiicola]KAI1940670.1 hypothetical protein LOZ66_002267 [Ophidiomyces ophidiicola]KAI1956685.1 hypothetical protein LOZ58_006187 [Ophidiomyces ophidiicola]
MNSLPCPIIKLFDFISDFLEHILQESSSGVKLVVCWSKEKFLQQLRLSIQQQSYAHLPGLEAGGNGAENSASPFCRTLLSNTIDIIDKSQKITLSFCPTLESFRAFLGTYTTCPRSTTESDQSELRNSPPVLAIVGLAALHLNTCEFSAQGISRSLALVVETAARERLRLILCECQDMTENGDIVSSGSIWNTRVPVLNIADKMKQHEVAAGQTVEIKMVVRKWFRFDTTEADELVILNI